MKKFIKAFMLRGLLAASGGPVILAIIYFVLGETGAATALSPKEVSLGIISITLLALIVGGMSAIYQLEHLSLATAIGLHGAALYAAYILTYVINGWLQRQLVPVLVFTAIFIAGYALIWLIIYCITVRKTRQLNEKLRTQA